MPVDLGEAHAGVLAHDINNLLTAILGHADIALGHPDLPDAARGDLAEIVHAARQAALLTRQLLALRRPPSDRSVVDLRLAAEAMVRLMGPLMGDRIALRAETGPTPIWVEASAADLEGIVLNLAINARDAMPSGGTLTLATAVVADPAGPRAAVSVADTGIGMDLTTRERAFEPYFTTKGPGRGSGLGLASVAATTDRNGWVVTVASEPGRGSRFTVTMPLADRPLQGNPPPPRPSRSRRGRPEPVGAESHRLADRSA
jgi:two-component system cell cycle sensor histidine kinase/response regulator CckA